MGGSRATKNTQSIAASVVVFLHSSTPGSDHWDIGTVTGLARSSFPFWETLSNISEFCWVKRNGAVTIAWPFALYHCCMGPQVAAVEADQG